MRRNIYWPALVILLIVSISGCASVRHAIPPDLLSSAQVFGMQDIRAFSGSPSEPFKKDFIKLLEQEKREGGIFSDSNSNQTFHMLAISGGAANGAYGAGLLSGWSETRCPKSLKQRQIKTATIAVSIIAVKLSHCARRTELLGSQWSVTQGNLSLNIGTYYRPNTGIINENQAVREVFPRVICPFCPVFFGSESPKSFGFKPL